MKALHALVRLGEGAAPELLGALDSEHVPTRILAAQALGYLRSGRPHKKLVTVLEKDASAAVRLYAVDSLGMQGGADLSKQLTARREKEKNGDVRKHIGYALARKGKGLPEQVTRTLRQWNLNSMNTAVLGKPAPDFELATVGGKKIRLSQFRGRRAVVLVFIYGDT